VLEGEARACVGGRGLAHGAPALGVPQDADRCGGHPIDVADRAERPGLAVAHHLGEPAGAAGHDRHARRQRLQGREAEGLVLAGQQEEVRAGQQRRHCLELAQEVHLPLDPECARLLLRVDALGTVTHHEQHARHLGRRLGEDTHHIPHALHGAEVRHVHDHLATARHEPRQRRRMRRAIVDGRIDEVVDHLDAAAGAAECGDRLRAQVLRHRRDVVGALDRELGDRVERRILADDGDVGAVQRGHHLHVVALVAQHLARDPRAGGVRQRVMAVQHIQAMRAHHLVHAHREREIVGRVLEQRVPADVDLVEEDARQEVRQPEGLLVRDEVDLVAARRERDPELGGDGAGAAVGRVAGDTDLHARSSEVGGWSGTGAAIGDAPSPAPCHQSSAIASASGSSGFTR
jgi:hypothetical protein